MIELRLATTWINLIKNMWIPNNRRWISDVVDFLASSTFLLVAAHIRDPMLLKLSGEKLPGPFVDSVEPYAPLIVGCIYGVLVGMYLVLKRRVSLLFLVLGMWLYPLIVLRDFGHFGADDIESWLSLFSEVFEFIGIFVVIYWFAKKIANRITRD